MSDETTQVIEETIEQKRERLGVVGAIDDAVIDEWDKADKNAVDSFSESLLHALLNGDISYQESNYGNLLVAYKQYVEIPEAWTIEQAVTHIRTGVEPAKNSKGVWLVDVTRKGRAVRDWTTAELESWALGDIKVEGKTNEEQAAKALKERLNLDCKPEPKLVKQAYKALSNPAVSEGNAEASKPVSIEPAPEETLQVQISKAATASLPKVAGLTPMSVAMIDQTLSVYIDRLMPGRPVSEAQGKAQQINLDTMLQFIISKETTEMVAGLERIRKVFTKEMDNGVFDASHVFRFTHLLDGNNNKKARHIALLELMRIYFGKNKAARKQCDIRALVKYQPQDKQDLLVEYFQSVV